MPSTLPSASKRHFPGSRNGPSQERVVNSATPRTDRTCFTASRIPSSEAIQGYSSPSAARALPPRMEIVGVSPKPSRPVNAGDGGPARGFPGDPSTSSPLPSYEACPPRTATGKGSRSYLPEKSMRRGPPRDGSTRDAPRGSTAPIRNPALRGSGRSPRGSRSSGTRRRRSGCNSPMSASAATSRWNGASFPTNPMRSVPSRADDFPSRAVSLSPARIPPERDASPPTSFSVRSIPGTVIVPPLNVARALKLPKFARSRGDVPPASRETRERVPPRTTPRATRTAGTSPASARMAERIGGMSASRVSRRALTAGDSRSTVSPPESRTRGSSMERSERAACSPFAVHSADPLKASARNVRLRAPRRTVRTGTPPANSAFPLRSPSDAIRPRRVSTVSPSQGAAPGAIRSTKSPIRNLSASMRVSPRSPFGCRLGLDRQVVPVPGRAADGERHPFRRQADPGVQIAQGNDQPVRIRQVEASVPDRDDRGGSALFQRGEEGGDFSLDLLRGERFRGLRGRGDFHPEVRAFQQEAADADLAAQQGEEFRGRFEFRDLPLREAGDVERRPLPPRRAGGGRWRIPPGHRISGRRPCVRFPKPRGPGRPSC